MRRQLSAIGGRAFHAAATDAPVAVRRSAFELEAALIAVRSAADLTERLRSGPALRDRGLRRRGTAGASAGGP